MDAGSMMVTSFRAGAPSVNRLHRQGPGSRTLGERAIWGDEVLGGSSESRGIWGNTKLPMSALSTGAAAAAAGRRAGPAGASISAILTPDISKDTLSFQSPFFEREAANPKNVAAIILGGGAGTRLFPLTNRRSEPAVPLGGSYRLIDIPMSNCINSGISKIYVMTQFNSWSLNRHLARTYNFGNGVNFGDGFVEVLAATQTPGGMNWFQGTADAVRQFIWVFEDARNKNVEHILILSGDQLYRMDYMDLLQRHIDTRADITVSCVPMDDSRASDFGLMKIDKVGRIIHFSEKPKGSDLDTMKIDTTVLGLSPHEAKNCPYVASMGVYAFRTDILLKLLRWRYPTSNDFGSEIIPSAVSEFNVQAYLFRDYWEDIGTIKSFFDANMALTGQSPKFQFYDPKTPFYTSPRYLPPTKVDKCRIVNSVISHGCFLDQCSIEHSIVGDRSRLEYGVELKDTMMMGADYYQTEAERAALLAESKVPIGVGQQTKIRNCIIDKNAKIGKNVIITNKDGVQEADRPSEGFYIRSGLTVILKNSTIKDGTVM
nr:ADP-glucose pyrophosphorylase large subunit 1 [Colocasia esculenta]